MIRAIPALALRFVLSRIQNRIEQVYRTEFSSIFAHKKPVRYGLDYNVAESENATFNSSQYYTEQYYPDNPLNTTLFIPYQSSSYYNNQKF
jgi:hypothetical protein